MPVIITAPCEGVSVGAEHERMARSTSSPHRCVVQVSGLLLAVDGEANAAIAVAYSPDTVRSRRTEVEWSETPSDPRRRRRWRSPRGGWA